MEIVNIVNELYGVAVTAFPYIFSPVSATEGDQKAAYSALPKTIYTACMYMCTLGWGREGQCVWSHTSKYVNCCVLGNVHSRSE